MRTNRITLLDEAGNKYCWVVDWSSSDTDITKHLLNLNAVMHITNGKSLEHVILTSPAWERLINNKTIIERSGTAPTISDKGEPLELEGIKPAFSVRLSAIPWLTFHIHDVGEVYEPKHTT